MIVFHLKKLRFFSFGAPLKTSVHYFNTTDLTSSGVCQRNLEIVNAICGMRTRFYSPVWSLNSVCRLQLVLSTELPSNIIDVPYRGPCLSSSTGLAILCNTLVIVTTIEQMINLFGHSSAPLVIATSLRLGQWSLFTLIGASLSKKAKRRVDFCPHVLMLGAQPIAVDRPITPLGATGVVQICTVLDIYWHHTLNKHVRPLLGCVSTRNQFIQNKKYYESVFIFQSLSVKQRPLKYDQSNNSL